jgi:hypothetical protein
MVAAVCAVGRLGPDGPWVGFSSAAGGRFDLVASQADRTRRARAEADDLVSMALAFFEESLADPPEELAATVGDIGTMVRELASVESRSGRRMRLELAVDAVDDGLAADVVVSRLVACLDDGEEPIARLKRRAIEMLGSEQT